MAKLFGIKHSWQQGKKMVGPISFTIIVFFLGQQTCIRMMMKHNNFFLKTLCFIYVQVIGLFLTCENV
jgi:hypothetical protein